MTLARYRQTDSSSLRDVSQPGDHAYLGYVPVTWPDTGTIELIDGPDDWREVPFFHPGDSVAALAALQAVYGPAAEL